MKRLLLPLLATLAAVNAHAQIVLTTPGQSYSQNFDTLTTNTVSTPWANNSTLTGWSLFTKDGAAITSYLGGTGSSNTGSFYSFGATASTDRALGGVASGGTYFGSPASAAVAGYFAVALNNDTGTNLTSFAVSFDGEQWRNGGNTSAQTAVLQYGFGDTFAAVSSWTPAGAAFNFTSPTVGASAAALDGNAAANRVVGLGGTVATSWLDGDTLWLRWVENNDVGNDHGLAIDNFSFVAIPEPATYGLLVSAAALGLAAWRRRRVAPAANSAA